MRNTLLLLSLALSTAQAELTLETNRTVAFDTEQVSWLSLDVHPSGNLFVLEVLGDLYTLPIDGGEATRITNGPAFDSQPRFSPDGKRIVFISDRSGSENLWTVAADGSDPKQLTQSKGNTEYASPAFSPDGTHVVASRTTWDLRTFELWAYHLDGGKGVQLTKAKSGADTPIAQRHNALGAAYSPDGRYLYFARKAGGFAYNVSFPLWQIARRDLRDGREDSVTAVRGSAVRPALSPDGKLLVYATRYEAQTGLRVRDLDTGEDRWLAYPVEHDEQESRFTRDLFPSYAFAPDGEHLYYSRDGRIERLNMASGERATVPMRIRVEQALAPHLYYPYRLGKGPVKARLLLSPELSPDGKRVAFSAFMGIYVHDFEAQTTTRITDEDTQAFDPTWAPDGKRIAFVSWNDDGGHIWQVSARGGRARQLTDTQAHYTDPAYSRDGERIVALRASAHERIMREWDFGPPVGTEVVWLPAKGGATQTIVPAGGLGRPHFGPDADRVVLYLSGSQFARAGDGGLVSVRYDGTDRRALFVSKGPGIYAAEGDIPSEDAQLSPDGRHVLVQHANQLYLVRTLGQVIGGVEQTINAPVLPQVKLTDVGADHFGWAADGESVYWSVGHTVYRRPLASITFVASDEEASSEDNGDDTEKDDSNASQEKEAEQPAEAAEGVVAHLIELYKPRHAPEGTVALTGVTVLSMEPGFEPVSDATVVIRGSRIEAVGQSITPPADARVIDLQGRFVVPGFIDTHAHYRPLRGTMDRSSPAFLASLAYGVTTGIDVQPSTVDIIAYEDMIDAGLMLGPRALSTGPGVFSNNAFKSRDHALHVLRRYRDHYGVRNLKAYISGSREQRQWLAQAAAELKLMPTTEGGLDMKLDITHIIDGFSGNEHNYPLIGLYDDVVRLTAESKIAYTPTLLVTYGGPSGENYFYTNQSPMHDAKLARFTPQPHLAARTERSFWAHEREYTFDEIAEGAARIMRAGGRVGVGGHGQLQGLGYHWELQLLASGGATPRELLTAATRHGAEMIGVGEDIGTVSVGKLADLVVLDADPLADITNTTRIAYVVKNGEVFEGETLNMVWPESRPLADQWWWHLPPPQAGEATTEPVR